MKQLLTAIGINLPGHYEGDDYVVDIDNSDEINKLEKIDYVLNKYIEDYTFRKQMQKDVLSIRVKAGNNFIKNTLFFNGNVLC